MHPYNEQGVYPCNEQGVILSIHTKPEIQCYPYNEQGVYPCNEQGVHNSDKMSVATNTITLFTTSAMAQVTCTCKRCHFQCIDI